jgi:aquaporin Z
MRPALLAELLGAFMLVLAGTGAIIINDVSGGAITHLGIALSFGLIVLAVIYTYGDVSGAHINPAVTIAFWAAKRFPGKHVLPYIAAQCIGAIAASAALKLMFPDHPTLGATLPSGSVMQSFVLELILSWWLMTVILAVAHGAKEKGVVAGIVIGAVVMVEALFAGPICGASMNPARSLAPALLSQNMEDLWIYLTAPVLGMVLAVWSCRFVHGERCCTAGRCGC